MFVQINYDITEIPLDPILKVCLIVDNRQTEHSDVKNHQTYRLEEILLVFLGLIPLFGHHLTQEGRAILIRIVFGYIKPLRFEWLIICILKED